MTKEEHEVPESSTRGNPGLRARGHPDPAELTGGKLPHVLNPLLLPPNIGPEIF